jgi:arginyl-tRNA synthetase
MTIENTIVQQIKKAVSVLYQTDIASDSIVIQETRKEFEGQVTAVTFPFTRFSKKTPEQTGTEIGEYLKDNVKEVENFNVIKGFLNLSITDTYWIDELLNTVHGNSFGQFPSNGQIPINLFIWVTSVIICWDILSLKSCRRMDMKSLR